MSLIAARKTTLKTTFALHDTLGDEVDESPFSFVGITGRKSSRGFSFGSVEFERFLETLGCSVLVRRRSVFQVPDTDGGKGWGVVRETFECVEPVFVCFFAMRACKKTVSRYHFRFFTGTYLPSAIPPDQF